jgi:CBS domain containing-hemolysin-like protein
MPKIYSRGNPERIVLSVIRPLVSINRFFLTFIKPIIWFVDRITKSSVTVPASKMSSLSVEEIKSVIIESSAGGQIETDTTKMLEGALKLSKIEVSQIMQPSEKVECVSIEDNPQKVVDKLIETGRSRIPVYSENRNKIVGIVLLKDLITSSKVERIEFNSEIIRPVYSVPLNKKVDELLREFQRGTTHCAVIVDSEGNMKGFVTLEDIIEEIVGEIVDEYELAKQKLLK